MANYYFNDLCVHPDLCSIQSFDDARSSIKNFITVCSVLQKKGFGTLRTKGNIKNKSLLDGYDIAQWLNDDTVEREQKTRFRSLATHPFIPQEELEKIDPFKLHEFSLQGKEINADVLGLAYLHNTICISFLTSDIWDLISIRLIYSTLDDKGDTLIENIVDSTHVASITHIDTLTSIIEKITSYRPIAWKPSQNFFPNIEETNKLIGDYYTERNKKSEGEKLAYIIEIGTEVAEKNRYTKNSRISALNSTVNKKRVIFEAGDGSDKIYLSIDMETGGFEVCDYRGIHLGEYAYNGEKRKGAETDHNIKLS